MRPIRSVGLSVLFLGLGASWTPSPGADSPALAILKAAGLAKSGRVFVIEDEAPALARIKETRAAITAYAALADRQARVEQAATQLTQLEEHRAELQEQLTDLNQRIIEQSSQQIGGGGRGGQGGQGGGMMSQQVGGGMGGSGGGGMASQMIFQRDSIKQTLAEIKLEQKTLKDQAPQVSERSAMDADVKAKADALRATITEIRPIIDGVTRKYAELAADKSIKGAISELERASKASLKIGPSDAFVAAVKAIDSAEQRLTGRKVTTVSRKKSRSRK